MVRQVLGKVRVVNCTFQGAYSLALLDEDNPPINGDVQGDANGGFGALVTAADIAFVRCQLTGGASAYILGDLLSEDICYCLGTQHSGGDGLRALNSNVSLYDVLLRGGVGGDEEVNGADGGDGLILLGTGSLFASGCAFMGADAGDGYDCIFSRGGDGGRGLFVSGNSPARFLDCTYSGGAAGWGCSGSGVVGKPHDINSPVDNLAGIAHDFFFPLPVREQQLASFGLEGHPDDQVFVVFGAGESSLYVKDFSGQLHVTVPWLNLIYVGAVPASGALQLSVPVPELGPGVEGVSLRLQPLFLHVADGRVILGNWGPLLLLDQSL